MVYAQKCHELGKKEKLYGNRNNQNGYIIIMVKVWTVWFKPIQSFSWLANKLLKLKDIVYLLIKHQLENGLTARFWYDSWLSFELI